MNAHLDVNLDQKRSDDEIRADMNKTVSSVKAIAAEGEDIIRISVVLGLSVTFFQAISTIFSEKDAGRTLSIAIGGISAVGFSGIFILDQARRRYTLKALEAYCSSIENFLKARANSGEKNHD